MGQLITVTEKRGIRPDVVIFELNRSLTGMGHERYASAADATGTRPVDALARRLFEAGGVEGVHIYSNVVTVDLAGGSGGSGGSGGEGLADIIRDLFTYYREGVEVAEPI